MLQPECESYGTPVVLD